jgi:hypothetical protein
MEEKEMQTHCDKNRRVIILTMLLLVLCALSGCAVVGPKSISMGRADYVEAIHKTDMRSTMELISLT